MLGEDSRDLPLCDSHVDSVPIAGPGDFLVTFHFSQRELFTFEGQHLVTWPSYRGHLSPDRLYISPLYGLEGTFVMSSI